MRRMSLGGRVLFLSGAAMLLAGGAARAQTYLGSTAPTIFPGRRPAPNYGFPGGAAPSSVPQSQLYAVLPPSQPTSAPGALLDRDLQVMRSGSLRPDQFLYGQYNPRLQPIFPPANVFPGYGCPPGYYGGYCGGGFTYGYGNSGYGGFGYAGAPQVFQQEVYVLRDGSADVAPPASGPSRAAEAPRAPEPARREQRPDGGDFYLKNPAGGESLTDALDDIRKAWLNGDFDRIKARFKPEGDVRILLNGEYKYSLRTPEFLSIVKDAMKRIDTVAFEFDRPKSDTPGKVYVTGKHTFIGPSKTKQQVPISYLLERVDGKWKIVEAGSSDAKTISASEKPTGK